MIIAIAVAAVLMLWLANRRASRRLDRAELADYAQKDRREGAFPFDYLSR